MDSVPLPLLSILAMLPVFSLIVVVHEGGHFLAARLFGVRVEAFSIGFGPVLAQFRDRHGTRWRISALPLGGYVKFFGDTGAASMPDRDRLADMRQQLDEAHGAGAADACYHFKPVWQRMIIVAAGPAANFVLAIAIFASLAMSLPTRQIEPVVGGVQADSAAERAGFQIGDRLVSINGVGVDGFRDIRRVIVFDAGEQVDVVVDRGGSLITLTPVLQARQEDGMGRPVTTGHLGIAPSADHVTVARQGPLRALGTGVDETWNAVSLTGQFVASLFEGKASVDMMAGPVGMFQMAGEGTRSTIEVSQEAGVQTAGTSFNVVLFLLQFAAIISIGIGLVNLLPILPLDGGHLMVYGYEAIAGRPLGERVQDWGFRIGFAVIVSFMLFVTLADLRWTGVFDGILG